jgi:hypothetical protein
MRGNAHHLQLIASAEEVGHYRRSADYMPPKLNLFRRLRALFVNPPMNVIKTISHLEGPAVLLEYLENGDLLTFWNTIWNYKAQIPNRLLWRMYLCRKQQPFRLSRVLSRGPMTKWKGMLTKEIAVSGEGCYWYGLSRRSSRRGAHED